MSLLHILNRTKKQAVRYTEKKPINPYIKTNRLVSCKTKITLLVCIQLLEWRGSLTLPKIIDFHISSLNGLFLLLF